MTRDPHYQQPAYRAPQQPMYQAPQQPAYQPPMPQAMQTAPVANNESQAGSDSFSSKASKLKELKELLDAGVLTQEEFDNEKTKTLNS